MATGAAGGFVDGEFADGGIVGCGLVDGWVGAAAGGGAPSAALAVAVGASTPSPPHAAVAAVAATSNIATQHLRIPFVVIARLQHVLARPMAPSGDGSEIASACRPAFPTRRSKLHGASSSIDGATSTDIATRADSRHNADDTNHGDTPC
ncbi:MAG: hypothetical protein AB7P21_26965 [Lautropia sp.]